MVVAVDNCIVHVYHSSFGPWTNVYVDVNIWQTVYNSLIDQSHVCQCELNTNPVTAQSISSLAESVFCNCNMHGMQV